MNASWFISLLRLRDPRRKLMFWLTLLLMGMTFVGGVVLLDVLAENPYIFTVYWGLVFLQVLLVLSLAFYDMLSVSREFRAQARQNAERFITQANAAARPLTDREDAPSRDSNP